MTRTPDLSTAVWRKSSYSEGGANDCVEVSDDHPGIVPVRDSKRPDGSALIFSVSSWSAFMAGVKSGADVHAVG